MKDVMQQTQTECDKHGALDLFETVYIFLYKFSYLKCVHYLLG